MAFIKATKKQSKLRLALSGPSGSGKTYTALLFAQFIARECGGEIAVIDSEHGSASKYADKFEFDVNDIGEDQSIDSYIKAIKDASGYSVLIIDSLSHSWVGKGGALESVTEETNKSKSGNSFQAWGKVTPKVNELINTILSSPCHVIATMRSKTEYVMETNARGKTVPKKVGAAPVIREGIDYEFDVFGEMNLEHGLHFTKSRCSEVADGFFEKPGAEVAKTLFNWVTTGIDEMKELREEFEELLKGVSKEGAEISREIIRKNPCPEAYRALIVKIKESSKKTES